MFVCQLSKRLIPFNSPNDPSPAPKKTKNTTIPDQKGKKLKKEKEKVPTNPINEEKL